MARYFYKTFKSIEAKINFDPSAKRFSRSKKEPNLQSWPKNMAKTAKNGVVLDTTSNVQPI